MILSQEVSQDCVSRVKVKYTFTRPISEADIRSIGTEALYEIQITDLRQFIPQSKVLYTMSSRDGIVMILGALGLDYLTVTYTRDGPGESARGAMEQVLGNL